jgi:tetratricopeptide (TPR) repeat protein
MSVREPERAVTRLLGLGLLDAYGLAGDPPAAAVNDLARPLFDSLSDDEQMQIANAVAAPLFASWANSEGHLAVDPRAVLVARLALLAQADAQIVNASALSASGYLFIRLHRADLALRIVLSAIETLKNTGARPDLHLLRIATECADRMGEGELQDHLLKMGLAIEGAAALDHAIFATVYANRLIQKGHLEEALEELRRPNTVFEKLGDVRSLAITNGRIADILFARGDLDAALKIKTEEELPTFEKLGDVRSLAITKSQIADILFALGDLDAALKIRTNEELPTYEKLGDVRSLAVAKGKIADILFARGDLDAALKIRTEEQLPIFEKLGDARSLAVAKGKIADILVVRGDLDVALKIRTEEQLPIFEKLGDMRSLAVAKAQIADILEERGDLDAALKIRTEEELPIFTKLGDVRELAITKGRIANIFEARGDYETALKLHEENLPTAQRTRDADIIVGVKFAITRLQISLGFSSEIKAKQALEDLAESYGMARQLDRPDLIVAIGVKLAGLFLAGKAKSDAIAVLHQVGFALDRLGRKEDAARIRAQIEKLDDSLH